VKADIGARVITVEGTVEGNLNAQEQIILRGSALVHGNIKAPRVVLEDGSRFRGGVDMGEPEEASLAKTGPQPGWSAGANARGPAESKVGSERDSSAAGAAD
jgi:cytoskeletal protein CcmA (bactofilin family)